MRSNVRIASAVAIGLGTWFLGCYLKDAAQQRHKRVTKKLTKEAVHAWEGEGGTIIDPVPRSASI